MEFLSLEIENFGPFEQAFINLNDRGLVNIEGVNKDDPSATSNGSGKSSLPDALYWCLFGSTARDVSGDAVISNFAGKDCIVTTTLREGAVRYMVERWRKKKHRGKSGSGLAVFRYDEDGGVTDLTKGKDDLTQEVICTILGCSEEVFIKAVYSGQEALPDLPKMTDKQIKVLIEEAAGTEVLASAYDLAKTHLRGVTADHAVSMRDLVDEERRLNDIDAKLKDYDTRKGAWEGEQAFKVAAKNKMMTLFAERAREIDADRKLIDREALIEKLTALRASVSAVDVERTTEREMVSKVSSARSEVSKAQAALDAKLREISRASTHAGSVDGAVGTPCGECGKTYAPEDLADAKRLAAEKLKALTAEGVALKKVVAKAEAFAETEQQLLDAYRETMTDITATVKEIAALDTKVGEHDKLTSQLTQIATDARRTKAELEALKAETNPFLDMWDHESSKREAQLKEVAKALALTHEREKLVEIATDAAKVFGPSGVRAFVLDTVTPLLNERTAHYLGTLSDGRIEAVWTTLAKNAKGELIEKFAIEVEKTGGGKSFKALSGGEKRKVRLACALALQDLVGSRATKPLNLWIGDEVDDALDDAGLERLMAVLEAKAREKGTVLVISHNSLRDWIRETVTVTMEDERSTVSGALC